MNYLKKAVIFDLDGTLTLSKSAIDDEMSSLLCKLLKKNFVAVISGGAYSQFKKQLLPLKCGAPFLKNLALFPTSGSSGFLFHKGRWLKTYEHALTSAEKKSIKDAFKKVFQKIKYSRPEKTYGAVIEDRGSQITFSALGQKAPLKEKEEWNKKKDKRLEIKKELEKHFSNSDFDFKVRLGGLTSIDVTRKNIDKAYAVKKFLDIFSLSPKEAVFVGDALYEGGNDFEVTKTKIDTVPVMDPKETKLFIKTLLIP